MSNLEDGKKILKQQGLSMWSLPGLKQFRGGPLPRPVLEGKDTGFRPFRCPRNPVRCPEGSVPGAGGRMTEPHRDLRWGVAQPASPGLLCAGCSTRQSFIQQTLTEHPQMLALLGTGESTLNKMIGKFSLSGGGWERQELTVRSWRN